VLFRAQRVAPNPSLQPTCYGCFASLRRRLSSTLDRTSHESSHRGRDVGACERALQNVSGRACGSQVESRGAFQLMRALGVAIAEILGSLRAPVVRQFRS